ncbi:MAG: hypothetical protein EGQ00_02075 [Parabacteroides johnsonii]|jgi:hypothetical protein|uniref:hypothetical protein n=1 Tax=uncultured Parabacteroides sp. TaxID=512312 RepID=UPI0026082B91|nr:hypothetical protein [uncultured Parabacteroides sp.]MBD9165830.1 hypothetical protein [Parabacteroides johnsonii]
MRKLIYSLIICLMAVTGKSSAQEGKSEYLFNDFQKSLIYYKDGRVFSVKVNYNLARNAFMFIDENDNNNIKLFAEPDMVRTLKIDNRIFQLDSKGLAQEHLNQEPYLAVTYRGKSRPEGKQVGYGGRSETASVDSYSSIQSGGHSYNLETEKIILADVEKRYTIKKNKKQKQFQSSKQFLKLYPKEQEETIKAYIKSNKINFDEPQQVLQLVKYAEAL